MGKSKMIKIDIFDRMDMTKPILRSDYCVNIKELAEYFKVSEREAKEILEEGWCKDGIYEYDVSEL